MQAYHRFQTATAIISLLPDSGPQIDFRGQGFSSGVLLKNNSHFLLSLAKASFVEFAMNDDCALEETSCYCLMSS